MCDTGVIHESGIYHTLHIMFINTYKEKCDRVIEDSGKTTWTFFIPSAEADGKRKETRTYQ